MRKSVLQRTSPFEVACDPERFLSCTEDGLVERCAVTLEFPREVACNPVDSCTRVFYNGPAHLRSLATQCVFLDRTEDALVERCAVTLALPREVVCDPVEACTGVFYNGSVHLRSALIQHLSLRGLGGCAEADEVSWQPTKNPDSQKLMVREALMEPTRNRKSRRLTRLARSKSLGL